MKTIVFLLAVFSLAVAQKPPVKSNRQVLLDFRVQRNAAPPRIPNATQRTVLSKVFRRYLTDDNKCNPQFDAGQSNDRLASARRAGQIVPLINDVVNGSFTAPGQTQTLYVIAVNECNATHADNFGTKRVAIFSGQQLVADVDVEFKSRIVRKTDLDGDGVDELLMTTSDMGQGTYIAMATLVSFQNGRHRAIEEFGTVIEDSCATGRPKSTTRASVLYLTEAAPGKMPRLSMENYESPCSTRKRWRFVSSGRMQ